MSVYTLSSAQDIIEDMLGKLNHRSKNYFKNTKEI